MKKKFLTLTSLLLGLHTTSTWAAEESRSQDSLEKYSKILFEECVSLERVPPISSLELKETVSATDKSDVSEVKKDRENLAERYKKAMCTHEDYIHGDADLVRRVPLSKADEVKASADALPSKITGLANAVLVKYLQVQHQSQFDSSYALNLTSVNKFGSSAFTVSNILAQKATDENAASTYGDYGSCSKQFTINGLFSNKDSGFTSFKFVAQFCGVKLECDYTSSYRFYDSKANLLIFNKGQIQNPQHINLNL